MSEGAVRFGQLRCVSVMCSFVWCNVIFVARVCGSLEKEIVHLKVLILQINCQILSMLLIYNIKMLLNTFVSDKTE